MLSAGRGGAANIPLSPSLMAHKFLVWVTQFVDTDTLAGVSLEWPGQIDCQPRHGVSNGAEEHQGETMGSRLDKTISMKFSIHSFQNLERLFKA